MPLVSGLASNCGLVLLLALVGTGFRDDTPKQNDLTARDAFWSAADLVGKPIPPRLKTHVPVKHKSLPHTESVTVKDPLGLRYSLLKRSPSGTFEEVLPDTTFHQGDQIRISVMSNQKGYLYIVDQGTSGRWIPLYPRAGDASMPLEPGHEYLVPNPGSYTFDSRPGQERVFVLLTREPEPDIDRLIASLQKIDDHTLTASNSIPNQTIENLRAHAQSRDLVFTGAQDSAAVSSKQDQASYVVNKAAESIDPHVKVDIVLSHQ